MLAVHVSVQPQKPPRLKFVGKVRISQFLVITSQHGWQTADCSVCKDSRGRLHLFFFLVTETSCFSTSSQNICIREHSNQNKDYFTPNHDFFFLNLTRKEAQLTFVLATGMLTVSLLSRINEIAKEKNEHNCPTNIWHTQS